MSESVLQPLQRMLGAYVGLAIGDALGATTEFLTAREISLQYQRHENIIGGGWLRLKAGQVTDDTEMNLALGEAILQQGGVQAEAIAHAFSEWMRTKPVDMGNTVRRGIVYYRTSGIPRVAENEYDAGNGACMRCLPIAIFHHDSPWQTVQQASQIQSHITHNNPTADAGTETVLKILIALFGNQARQHIEHCAAELVQCFPIYRFDKRRVENPSGWIVETLQSVFQAFFQNHSFSETLIDVVNRGGDSDTTGAIAGMLAGAYYGYDAIPKRWLKQLDPQILQRCQTQTRQLFELNQQLSTTR